MFLRVDPADKRPIYQQVADGIKALIARGDLRQGAPLPPLRQLAADLDVNLNTVATAYRQLQDEGLLTVRHGSGAVVASQRTGGQRREDLRRPLRTALAEMVLAGMSLKEILRAVSDELSALSKGAK